MTKKITKKNPWRWLGYLAFIVIGLILYLIYDGLIIGFANLKPGLFDPNFVTWILLALTAIFIIATWIVDARRPRRHDN